jgi:hypothetical protein
LRHLADFCNAVTALAAAMKGPGQGSRSDRGEVC